MNCYEDKHLFFVFFDFIFMRNKFRLEQIPKLQSFSGQWLQISFLLEGEVMHNCVATATESLITETPSLHLPNHSHSFPLDSFPPCFLQQPSRWKFNLDSPPRPTPRAWELFLPFSHSAHQSFPKQQHPIGASLGKGWNSCAFAFVQSGNK